MKLPVEIRRMSWWMAAVLWIVLTGAVTEDGFQEVIDQARNDTVRSKLIAFQRKGIERKISGEHYHPDSVLNYAMSFAGTPHKMGGTDKSGMDCSGLVMVAHRKFGVVLPHSSEEQARYGSIISRVEELQRGDLVFFYNSFRTKDFITHSGIYAGDGQFVHASNSKG